MRQILRLFFRHKIPCALAVWVCLCLPISGLADDTFGLAIKQNIKKKRVGDFDQMVDKRVIRALVPYSKTFYFLDGATPRGATYDILKRFEKHLNKELSTRHLKLHVWIIPTPRDKLISGLIEGIGDIACGNLTVTDNRSKQVDFSNPFASGVNEILVTGSEGSAGIKTVSDLSGRDVHVRQSSSYYESLISLNRSLIKQGRPVVNLIKANEYLEDEDLLEMVNAGLIPMMIIDSHKGEFWSQIFDNITLHPHIKVRENSRIAWAMRKNSPLLAKQINRFVTNNKKGTLHGNIILKRYLKDTKYVQNHYTENDRKRLQTCIKIFQKYAGEYDFDWLMLAALAYQESTIDQSKRSHAGAIGVMQVLQSTAKDKNINIPDIHKLEPNIHAGTKYLRFIMDRYFDLPGIDRLNKGLLTFAAYNAGPAKISRLRKEAAAEGLNPNIWFDNVETIAARRIGRETVQYVSNIFKYYIAYRLIFDEKRTKDQSKGRPSVIGF